MNDHNSVPGTSSDRRRPAPPQPVDSKRALGGRRRGPDFARRLASVRALTGYTADDEALVRATREILLPHARAIADALYQHLISHPETAVYFTLPDGGPDRPHLDARVHSLTSWLQAIIEGPLDERATAYAATIGLAHAQRGASPVRRVKGRYMVATMSFVMAALTALLDDAIDERDVLIATIAAWCKLLAIHLDLFLTVYGTAAANPHWY
ncbi:MAG TPA: protoglobin family protein [Dehalococcoidia bacterium]|nr:protoglobin family protein [Dehalococcoidia bacterium]